LTTINAYAGQATRAHTAKVVSIAIFTTCYVRLLLYMPSVSMD